jgi:hypothetical protein
MSYILTWTIIFIWYDTLYQIFPTFNFLSVLAKAFLTLNFIFFLKLSHLRTKKKINNNFFLASNFILLIIA